MGERGPAPKPTRLKQLEGNPGKRALPKNEPQPELGAPECPSWLSDTAKEEWQRVAPELERLGLLAKIDGTTLAAYCAAYARWRVAEEMIQNGNVTFVTEAGYIAQHPAIGIANKAMAELRAFAKEFGLTPSSRGRMSIPGVEEPADPLEQMLGAPALRIV